MEKIKDSVSVFACSTCQSNFFLFPHQTTRKRGESCVAKIRIGGTKLQHSTEPWDTSSNASQGSNHCCCLCPKIPNSIFCGFWGRNSAHLAKFSEARCRIPFSHFPKLMAVGSVAFYGTRAQMNKGLQHACTLLCGGSAPRWGVRFAARQGDRTVKKMGWRALVDGRWVGGHQHRHVGGMHILSSCHGSVIGGALEDLLAARGARQHLPMPAAADGGQSAILSHPDARAVLRARFIHNITQAPDAGAVARPASSRSPSPR